MRDETDHCNSQVRQVRVQAERRRVTHIVLDFELWDGNSSSKHSVTERVKRGASTHKQKRTPSRPQDVEPTRVVQLRVERVEQLREPAHLLPGRAPRQRRAFSLASVRTLS